MVRIYYKNKENRTECFESVKQGYYYYLDNYSTQEDYDYYYNLCKTNLRDVTDEEIMLAIFRNVFSDVNDVLIEK